LNRSIDSKMTLGAILGAAMLVGIMVISACVTYNGRIGRSEQRIIKRKFESHERRHGTEGSTSVWPERPKSHASTTSEMACGSKDNVMTWLGCLVFFYDGFTVMDAPGVKDAVSCATCHDPAKNFSDGLARAQGATRARLGRRTPSLYQAFNRDFLFWDGRIDSLWAQALLPFEQMGEMASNRVHVVRTVAASPGLRAAYEAAFPSQPLPVTGSVQHGVPCRSTVSTGDPSMVPESVPLDGAIPHETMQTRVQAQARQQSEQVSDAVEAFESPAPDVRADKPELATAPPEAWCAGWRQLDDKLRRQVNQAFVNIGRAIAAYELNLRSEGSTFDQALAIWRANKWRSPANHSDELPLSGQARRGLELFIGKAKCVKCHNGPDLTDDRFHYLGIFDLEKEGIPKNSSSMWLEGAFHVYNSPFNCNHAQEYGATCTGTGKLEGPLSIETLIRIGQKHVAGQVRTPSLRNVAEGTHFMHDGSRSGIGNTIDAYSHVLGIRRPVLVTDDTLRAKVSRRKKPVAIRRFRPTLQRGDRYARHIRLTETDLRHLGAFLQALTGAPIDVAWRTNPWPSQPAQPPPP